MGSKFEIKVPTAGGGSKRAESDRAAARNFFHADTTRKEESTPPADSTPREGATGQATATARVRAPQQSETVLRTDESSSSENGKASWRKPRADGKLRANDRMVIDYLRERVVDESKMMTDEVGMKEIASACSISHRTAQNTVGRLEMAKMVKRLVQQNGSNSGCRYRLLPAAPQSKFDN